MNESSNTNTTKARTSFSISSSSVLSRDWRERLAMKDRSWSTKNNALAEDLTGGEGEGWERKQERREEKKWKRDKRKLRKNGEYRCISKVTMWSIYRREWASKINENFGLNLTNVFYKLLLWPNFYWFLWPTTSIFLNKLND